MTNEDTEFEEQPIEGSVLAGRYRVAHVVSSGASTVLIDAIDIETDGQVSVKIVRPELARDDEFRRKFRRLAEVSTALTHPNIASVSDWGELDFEGESTVFWVVDALGGGSMRDLLDRGRLLEPGQALVVGLEACRALDAAHQKGLFHTEITPSKMVFGVDRRLRVVDFGTARLLAEGSWDDAATVPTHVARYASPEQALGLPVDAKTDVYALALVLTEAVTGSVPFAADSTVATLAGRVDKLLPVSADLGALASVLERAARPEAGDRFTAAEFGRALVQIAPKLPKPTPIPIVATGLFDTAAMRRPTDPTGGIERPAPVGDLDGVETEVLPEPDVDSVSATDIDPAALDEAVAVVAEVEAGEDDEIAVDDIADVVANESADDAVDDAGDDAVELDGHAPSDTPDLDVDSNDGAGLLDIPAIERRDDEPAVDDLRIIDDVELVVAAAPSEPDDEPEPVPAIDIPAAVEPVIPEPVSPEPVIPEAPTPTEVLPVADVDAARAAGEETTAVAATVAAPVDAAAGLYDDQAEASKRRKGPIVLLVLALLAGLGALGYAATLLNQPKSFEVPELAGVSEAEAMNQITGNDWDIATSGERSDTFPEPDTVIRTTPGPGIELEEGEPFTLVLSQGPEFRTLPEFDELSFEAATTQLIDLGLSAQEAEAREFSEDLPVGAVVSWRVLGDADGTMGAGAQILPGETIELTLSSGPEARVVPNLAGSTIDEATDTLSELRLTLVTGEDVFDDEVPIGQIVLQSPAPDSSLERDGEVSVQVSKGPDVIVFPALDGLTFEAAQTQLLDTGFVVGTLLGTTDGTFVEATIDTVDVEPGTEFRRGQVIDLIFL